MIPTSVEIQTCLPSYPAVVLADATQIHQILINLCSNAADAMAASGGVLRVVLAQAAQESAPSGPDFGPASGSFFKLLVSDTGEGISASDLERIFDPYYTTKEVGKGTGMGLSVVHGIVRSHGGAIQVRSQKQAGSEFEIRLPAAESSVKAGSGPDLPLSRGQGRIMLIDDEAPIVKLNQKRLESLGYQVSSQTDPRSALALFEADPHQFDLVVTDMTMPHMTGDQLARHMLKIRPDIKIILCTGYNSKISGKSAAELGIACYMEKPVEIQQLAEAVGELIKKSTSVF